MFCAITSHVHRIQSSTNNKTQKVSRCLLSTEARWRRLPLLSSVTRLGKRWRKQKADSLLCQVRRQGGAASDECKIDIHSQASLQPRDALIWVFIESFICRAKQLCRPREHTHRKPPKKHFYRQSFFILPLSVQTMMTLFYIQLCHPFRPTTRVGSTMCLAAPAPQIGGEKYLTSHILWD